MFIKGITLSILLMAPVIGAIEAAELRDPTRPMSYRPDVSKGGKDSLKLESILIAASRKIAVINGKEIHEKDWIGNIQVLKILPGAVLIERAGKRQQLKLRTPIRLGDKG